MSFQKFIHPYDCEMVPERFEKRLKNEKFPSNYVFRVNSKDEKEYWVKISVSVINWEGRPAILNFLTDITERKAVRDTDKPHSQLLFQSFIDNSEYSIYAKDLKGKSGSHLETEMMITGSYAKTM